MSKEEKKNVDIEGLSTLMRNCFVTMGVLTIIGHYILEYFKLVEFTPYVIVAVICLGLPVLLIKARKYDKN